MHQHQQVKNGEPVKIQEFRIFLQTKTVTVTLTKYILRLCQVQSNISSLNLEEKDTTDKQPYP